MKYRRGECLEVAWIDAFDEPAGWTSTVDLSIDDEYKVISCGFFYEESKDYIMIMADVAPGKGSRIMHIPKGVIKKVKKLK